jgi:hypothetical protein
MGVPTEDTLSTVGRTKNIWSLSRAGKLLTSDVNRVRALYEQLSYDEAGPFVAGTLLDYTMMDHTMPTAVELPSFEAAHQQSLSPFTPLGG